jgi:class 3 adenylate cyclase
MRAPACLTRRVWYAERVEGSGGIGGWVDGLLDRFTWQAALGAVAAVRYQPRQLDLALACTVYQPEIPAPAVRWLADARVRPNVVRVSGLPHAAVRAVAAQANDWFGPTASAVIRWCAGAVAKATDGGMALTLQRPLRARAHPGLLVPHQHAVAVLAADMRGFSTLTRTLRDTQYLADLVGEYLTELTRTVERHRGVVFQYTGDGLLALFLPELAGAQDREMLVRLVHETAADMHAAFRALYVRWRDDWRRDGRDGADVGLGLGLSFGPATIGFLGPAGKKQFGVIGEPVNLAAFLCSQAHAGSLLVDRDSFVRAGAEPPAVKVVRLRAKKRHHRIRAVCLRYV